jgi:hypothetical protein
MNAKTLIAGVAGGIVLFLWGSVAHLATPLSQVGIRSMPNEDAVMDAMRANITQPGLYFFPGLAPGQESDAAAMKSWEEKAMRGPAGIMVYQVRSEGALPPRLLINEAISNIIVGLLAAVVLAQIGGGLAFRAAMAGLIALIGSVDIYGSYWNWYKFPTDYTLAQTAILVVGYVLMGATIAAIAKKQ